MFRVIKERVGVNTTQVAEFSIGDTVDFYDEASGERGRVVIWRFAMYGDDPTIWYKTDDGHVKRVMLGWCTKV